MHLPALLSVAYVCSVKANLPVDANGASDNTNVQKKKKSHCHKACVHFWQGSNGMHSGIPNLLAILGVLVQKGSRCSVWL